MGLFYYLTVRYRWALGWLLVGMPCLSLSAAEQVRGRYNPGHYEPFLEVKQPVITVADNVVVAQDQLLSASALIHGMSVDSFVIDSGRGGPVRGGVPPPSPAPPIRRPIPLPHPQPVSRGTPIPLFSCPTQPLPPGNYQLAQDIVSTNGACLKIQNVSNVSLDCAGHSISFPAHVKGGAVLVTNAHYVAVLGCTAHAPIPAQQSAMDLEDSTNITLEGNDVESVSVYNSSTLDIFNNHIIGEYAQTDTSYTNFSGNVVQDYAGRLDGYCVSSEDGGNNKFNNNQLDGQSPGDANNEIGGDDGVLLWYEHDDQVSHNTIQNMWDMGVECSGTVTNTVISYNNIKNVGVTGIGQYNNTGWQNNLIIGNQVTKAPYLIYITFRSAPQFGPVPSTVNFQNNTIQKNTFSAPELDPWSRLAGNPKIGNPINIDLTPPSGMSTNAIGNMISGNIIPSPGPSINLVPLTGFTVVN